MNYLVIIKTSGANGSTYSAYSPDIPVFAAADSIEEALQLMQEGVEMYVEEVLADGRQPEFPQDIHQYFSSGEIVLDAQTILTSVTVHTPELA
jgi:predicted RNase H-like HicB family nuclease